MNRLLCKSNDLKQKTTASNGLAGKSSNGGIVNLAKAVESAR